MIRMVSSLRRHLTVLVPRSRLCSLDVVQCPARMHCFPHLTASSAEPQAAVSRTEVWSDEDVDNPSLHLDETTISQWVIS